MNFKLINISPLSIFRLFSFWLISEKSTKNTIFIIGVPRSGTTLLKSILTAHSKLGGNLGESTGIFGIRDIFEYKNPELGDTAISELVQKSSSIIEFYEGVVCQLLIKKGKEIFVDKIQPNPLRLMFIKNKFPNAKFIRIIRDGRACYASALKHPNVPQKSSVTRFAKYWKKMTLLPERNLPEERLYTIQYEAMTENPEKELSSLMNFLGLTLENIQLDPASFSATNHMRKREVHKNLVKPINTSSNQKWKSELSNEEIQIFNNIAKKELEYFGYEINP